MVADSRKVILAVDDEKHWLAAVSRTLSSDFELILSADPYQAIESVKSHHYSLVILDMRMPGKSGLEVLREMRQIEPDLPAIILTGYADLDSAGQSLRMGVVAYISKGTRNLPDKLRATVNSALANTTASDVGHAIQARGSKDTGVSDVRDPGQPLRFKSRRQASVRIEKRHASLVDKKFESSLSPSEEAELTQLERDLDEVDSVFYQPIKDELIAERTRLEERKQYKKK